MAPPWRTPLGGQSLFHDLKKGTTGDPAEESFQGGNYYSEKGILDKSRGREGTGSAADS